MRYIVTCRRNRNKKAKSRNLFAITHLAGIEMYGNSVPAGTVGGDLFEYINFQQRYDVDARIQRAATLSKEFLEPLKGGKPARNSVDDHVEWLKSRP